MRPRTWRACEPRAVRSSRSTRTALSHAGRAPGSRGRPPSRRCGRAPTSSSRRRSSMDVGVATPTSSIGPDRPSPVLGAYELRHRRHEALRGRQSRGDHPDVRLRRPARAASGRRAGVAVYVVTGDGVEHPHRLEDYAAYFRHAKARFEARVAGRRSASDRHVPRPGRSLPGLLLVSDVHPATARRRSPVDRRRACGAWIPSDSSSGGVPTLTAIATLPSDAVVTDISARALRRLRDQARLQLHERVTHERRLRAHPARAGRHRARPGGTSRANAMGRLLRHRGRSVGVRRRPRIPARCRI